MKTALLLLGLLTLSLSSVAIEEKKLTTPEFMNHILPAVLAKSGKGHFIGVNSRKINYYVMPAAAPKGVIVISPGQSESSLKYAELLFDLQDFGYTIYIIDHRGQGESDRLLNDPIKSHVNYFADYVTDFEKFVLEIVHPENYKSSFILAHSMGGAIASGFLVDHPKLFSGVILSAPMLEINTGYPELGSFAIEALLDNTFWATSYAPTQEPYSAKPFLGNKVTSSQARYNMRIALYDKYKSLQVGGTTNRWLYESLAYDARLRLTQNIFQVPTLLFQAGADQLVKSGGQTETCAINSPNFCKVILFSTSQHEILMETDLIRNQALQIIKNFISKTK